MTEKKKKTRKRARKKMTDSQVNAGIEGLQTFGIEETVKTNVLSFVACNPQLAPAEVSRMLNMQYSKVYRTMQSPAGKAMREEIEKDIAISVQRIKAKAMIELEKMLDSEALKPETKLSVVKFAVGNGMIQEEVVKPEELIFETVISESGAIEQTTRKIFHKSTMKVANQENEADDDTSVP